MNSDIASMDVGLCKHCAAAAISIWRGWPNKNVVPKIPIMENGECPICHFNESISGEQIHWLNHHGPYNTGLPDYWILTMEHGPTKWGRPYHSITLCPKCGQPVFISQFTFPNGMSQYVYNCDRCGIARVSSAQQYAQFHSCNKGV